MRKAIFLLVFCSLAFAATYPLNAVLSTESKIDVPNCRLHGGSTKISASFTIQNPSSRSARVTYLAYDFPTSQYVEGGKYCTLMPNAFGSCSFDFNVSLGGSGNGTISTVMLTLMLQDPTDPMKLYIHNKTAFTLVHFETDEEKTILGKIAQAESLLAGIDNNTECYAQNENDFREIFSRISDAREYLRFCNIQSALAEANNALKLASSARSKYDNCMATLTEKTEEEGMQPEQNVSISNQTVTNTTEDLPGSAAEEEKGKDIGSKSSTLPCLSSLIFFACVFLWACWTGFSRIQKE
ncbi:MAG: hypothetical protein QXP42_04240 [Candidatus Micrarchaeia archaeon]